MGKKPRMITIGEGRSLAAIIGRLVGIPYVLGGAASGRGLDCFSSIYRYLAELGQDLPDEFKGLTLETYAGLFVEDPLQAKEIMVEFIDSVADPIDLSEAFAGDILLLRPKDAGDDVFPFLGIHGGGANVVCSSREHGVTVYKRKNYTIMRAWRCRRQHQQ